MRRICVLTIASVVWLSACKDIYSNKNFTSFDLSDFENRIQATGQRALSADSLVLPTKCEIIKDHFLIIDQKNDKHIHVYNLKDHGYKGGYARTGQGPGEILLPWVTAQDDLGKYYVYDVKGRKMLVWNPDSLINNSAPELEIKFNEDGVTSSLAPGGAEIYFTDIVKPNGRFFVFNSQTRKTSNVGELPTLSRTATDINRSQAHRSMVARHQNTVIVANYLSPFFELYDIEQKSWKSFAGPGLLEPSFDEIVHTQNKIFVINEETRLGFVDVKATDKYFYLLYSGDYVQSSTNALDQGKDLLIFNHDGSPFRHIQLDKPLATFSVYNDSTVYGVTVDIKPEILRFIIN